MSNNPYRRACRETLVRAMDSGELVLDGDVAQEILWAVAEPVFSLEWCSGGPGVGGGVDTVQYLAGLYFPQSELAQPGPYETLEDAVHALWGEGGIAVSCATVSIWCESWTEEEIVSRIELFGEPPDVLSINGRSWPCETLETMNEKLRKRPGEEEGGVPGG